MKLRSRQRMSYRMVVLAATSFMLFFALGFFIYFQFGKSEKAYALPSNGDYRSKQSGSWGTATNWEKYQGGNWTTPSSAPTSSDGLIEILSGHTMTVAASVTADQILVDAGGTLAVSTGTLTLNNGTGTDITINGSMTVSSTVTMSNSSTIILAGTETVTSAGTINSGTSCTTSISSGGRFVRQGGTIPTTSSFWVLSSGSTFEHAMDGGTIPSLTWTSGSTCEVSGANLTLPSGLGQTFSNLKWNCTSQTGNLNLAAVIQTISKDFTIASTGTGSLFIDQQGNNSTMNIGGNFYYQGGTTYVCVNGSSTINVTAGNVNVTGGTLAFNQTGGTAYGNTSTSMNITGNLTVSGGTVDMSQYSGNNTTKGWGIINLTGNLTVSGTGLITETGNSRGQIYFTGTTAIQTYSTNNQITNVVDYTVNSGAILRTNNNVLTDDGDFTLMSGGGLMIGSAQGITKTTMQGNVQVTGTRSYSPGADYTYEGTAAQVSGDGLPSQERNLTINNSNNVTLTASTTSTGTQTFTTGIWIATNDTLTLGTSTTNLGTLSRTNGHVYGYYRRWVAAAIASNILFPVGILTYYNGANFSFTTVPTSGGSIVATFIPTNPGTLGLPLTDAGDVLVNTGYAYWQFGAMNGFAGGQWSVNLYANGFPGIADYTKLHVLRRVGTGTSWTINGTHSAGTGSNSAAVGNRTVMTSLGHYGIFSGSANPLPIELISFDAKLEDNVVNLDWKTATEINNDYFTIERSSNGKDFTIVLKVNGAGNSTTVRSYHAEDEQPLSGMSYYRLKQTDYDGKYTYSPIRNIKNSNGKNSEEGLTIEGAYPNPFSDHLVVKYKTVEEAVLTFALMGTDGRLISTEKIQVQQGEHTHTFENGESVSAGTYIVSISNDKERATKTVVKR